METTNSNGKPPDPSEGMTKWNELGFHTVWVLMSTGVGALLYFLHLPAEVTVPILIIEGIFIGQIIKRT